MRDGPAALTPSFQAGENIEYGQTKRRGESEGNDDTDEQKAGSVNRRGGLSAGWSDADGWKDARWGGGES